MLQSVRLGGGHPSYADHVAAASDPVRVELLSFSYRTALTGHWDVLHVHWPENLIRRRSRPRRALRAVLFALLLLRISVRRPGVVRTVHNVAPHEPGHRFERALLAVLDRCVTCFVRLNDETPVRPGVPVVTIPHGHYRDELDPAGDPPTDDGRTLLFFGFLRPYKGVDALVEAFGELADPSARLVIAGEPANAAMRALVEEAAAADPRVEPHLTFLSDEDLGALVRRATVVVLPYREIHNSGVLFAALSLACPVLVPENAVTAALRAEVGADWVRGFTHPLTAGDLSSALRQAADRDPAAVPDLAGREWSAVADRYAEVFQGRASTGARA
ncbi:Exopolysaccharide xanthan biosynthesis glycosyltransferase [Modestobacter italicus]|uniref:Exopolysaccharide xanthan biosynthesis glycosyltransferase n=1 Tax=Modestobacter italicus (strain DSM 44449 / CECT 9708 / BC 501) TaxID=2732864 RepID=I4ER90_MODI5|nr:Exopolysaccharide xanthan biosynthesis glycosyltransferase [Modestobacter marinus]